MPSKDKEKISAYYKMYYARNKEKIRLYQADYRLKEHIPSTERVDKREHQHTPAYYIDTGCQYAPKCQECPFPLIDGKCKQDYPKKLGRRHK